MTVELLFFRGYCYKLLKVVQLEVLQDSSWCDHWWGQVFVLTGANQRVLAPGHEQQKNIAAHLF